MVIALAYFTGITLIVGWALPHEAAAGRGATPVTGSPDTGVSRATAAPAKPMRATTRARSKANCPECGVIESVRTTHTRDELTGRCDAVGGRRREVSENVFLVRDCDEIESLADTVAAAIADEHGVSRIAATARQQIVVRFRDGTRHVLDEAPTRTLRVGDRINVIAGTAEANS
jgi:hypothetical protein